MFLLWTIHNKQEYTEKAILSSFCRSAITVFPQRKESKKDFRVWSPQLIRYAGYKHPDGTIVGDPASIAFTEVNKYYSVEIFA